MAPMCPEEVDVFTIPHTRMKTLVGQYHHMLTATNFANVVHLTNLLENLCKTFREFIAHEQIENRYIMKKLKNKLHSLSIENNAVCNCHKDNQLTDMLTLLQDGYKCTKKSDSDRNNYGTKLRQALEQFTETFIPHMEEEEEVFQPLLIQHFTVEELKQIKAKVIEQHFKVETEERPEKFVKDDKSSKQSDKVQSRCVMPPSKFDKVPDEVVMKIFSNLNPQDLCRASQVSTRWHCLAMDGSLWTDLYPVSWAKGNWDAREGVYEEESQESVEKKLEQKAQDEDADVDESEDCDDWDEEACEIQRQSAMLITMCKHLLPRVGGSVRHCDLAYSKGLTNGALYKILSLCPNLEYLDLTQTRISDMGFKGLLKNDSGKKLRHVDLSGCLHITDVTLERLGTATSGNSHVTQPCGHMTQACQEKQSSGHVTQNCQEKQSSGRVKQNCREKQSCDHVTQPDGPMTQLSSHVTSSDSHMVKQSYQDGTGEKKDKEKCCEKVFGVDKKLDEKISCCGKDSAMKDCENKYRISSTTQVEKSGGDCDDDAGLQVDQGSSGLEAALSRLRCCYRNEGNCQCNLDIETTVAGQSCCRQAKNACCDKMDLGLEGQVGERSRTNKDDLLPTQEKKDRMKGHKDKLKGQTEFERSRTKIDDLSYSEGQQSKTTWEEDHPLLQYMNSASPRNESQVQDQVLNDVEETRPTNETEKGVDLQSDTILLPRETIVEVVPLLLPVVKEENQQDWEYLEIPGQTFIPEPLILPVNDLPDPGPDINSCENPNPALAQPDSVMNKMTDSDHLTQGRSLEFLSLAGCYQITDAGLQFLAEDSGIPNLRHLDLSGCLNLSGEAVSRLVSTALRLEPANLFYCDNILDGPYTDTASGCQNLQCVSRVCCRGFE